MSESQKKIHLLETFILTAVLLPLCIVFSLQRFIAADEGFYLLASKLVMQGKSLYSDFFYPQMPGLPYFYGPFLSLFGDTWVVARVVASIFTVLILILFFLRARALTGRGMAYAGLTLLLTSGLFIGWSPLAKTYSLSTLLLLFAMLFYEKAAEDKSFLKLALSGIFVGLSVNVRLFYVVAIPVFSLAFLFEDQWKGFRIKALFAFCTGGFLTFLPHLYYMWSDFDSYWFNNVGYHLDRSHRSPEVDAKSRAKLTRILFGIQKDSRADGYEFPILIYSTLAYILFQFFQRRKVHITAWLAIALFVIHIMPDPIHYQYFSAVVPFALLSFLLLLKELLKRNSKGATLIVMLFLTLSLFHYLVLAPSVYHRFTVTGRGVKGISKRNRDQATLEVTSLISEKINALTKKGDYVLSLWPGYLLESDAEILPGLENQFWLRVSHKITKKERRKYHLLNGKEIAKSLENPKVTVLVTTPQRVKRYFSKAKIKDLGYSLKDEVYGMQIYSRTVGHAR